MGNRNSYESILKRIFLGSIVGLLSNSSESAINIDLLEFSGRDIDLKDYKIQKDLSPKLVLKYNNNSEFSFASHRSHRSHSSHRSHMSHRSHYSSSTSTTAPPQSNTSTVTVQKLGSRTLKRDMTGYDVTELINILLEKKYLVLESGENKVAGQYTYTVVVENAVKEFQKDVGLKADGICGTVTIYYLKNK